MSKSTRIAWQPHENQAIVAVYMDMLKLELAGKKVVKAHYNQKLQRLIGRSHKSIEFKHQNISAVMREIGLPFINGYKPAKNYQKDLIMVVVEYITAHGIERVLANAKGATKSASSALVYQKAPVMKSRQQAEAFDIHQFIIRQWPATRDAKLRQLGAAGEKFVFNAEKARLKDCGNLASKVRWVAKEDGDGAGFDILSFSKQGKERFLEVKTTNGSATTPFWITANELRVSQENQDKFRIIRLYNFARKPTAYKLKPPLQDRVKLEAKQYLASF